MSQRGLCLRVAPEHTRPQAVVDIDVSATAQATKAGSSIGQGSALSRSGVRGFGLHPSTPSLLDSALDRQPSTFDGGQQRGVVGFGLVGVAAGEDAQRVVDPF